MFLRTEHDDAVRLVCHSTRDRVRERADYAEIAGISVEQILAARGGDDQGTDALGERFDRSFGPGLVGTKTGNDERVLRSSEHCRSRRDRGVARRLWFPIRLLHGKRCRGPLDL